MVWILRVTWMNVQISEAEWPYWPLWEDLEEHVYNNLLSKLLAAQKLPGLFTWVTWEMSVAYSLCARRNHYMVVLEKPAGWAPDGIEMWCSSSLPLVISSVHKGNLFHLFIHSVIGPWKMDSVKWSLLIVYLFKVEKKIWLGKHVGRSGSSFTNSKCIWESV